jgi:hypothetical protein
MRTPSLSSGFGFVTVSCVLALLVLSAAACGGEDEAGPSEQTQTASEAGKYTAQVDHPLVPLATVGDTVFEGSETDADTGESVETRAVKRVLTKTRVVGGIPVTVVEVKEYEDDELVERTLDYYAQREDGSVWYVGETVDDYEDGKIVGHEGAWQAGQGNAKPGLFMPAEPKVGQEFEQEQAPGVAEDRSKVVAVGVDVTTPAGTFSDCIKTEDYAPLDDITEFKHYCPDVGLVREEGPGARLELVRYTQR